MNAPARRIKFKGQVYVQAVSVKEGLDKIEPRIEKMMKDLDYCVSTSQKIKHEKLEHQFKAMRAYLRKILKTMDETAPESEEESAPRG